MLKPIFAVVLLILLVAGIGAAVLHLSSPISTVPLLVLDISVEPPTPTARIRFGGEFIPADRSVRHECRLTWLARAPISETPLPSPIEDQEDVATLHSIDTDRLLDALRRATGVGDERESAPKEMLTWLGELALRGFRGSARVDGRDREVIWLAVALPGQRTPFGLAILADGSPDLEAHDVTIAPPTTPSTGAGPRWSEGVLRQQRIEHVVRLRFRPIDGSGDDPLRGSRHRRP